MMMGRDMWDHHDDSREYHGGIGLEEKNTGRYREQLVRERRERTHARTRVCTGRRCPVEYSQFQPEIPCNCLLFTCMQA